MGVYRAQLFPRIMDKLMDTEQTREIRARVCSHLSGEVVELGFGTGLNLPHLPSTVTRVRAVEPLGLAIRLAAARIDAASVPVEVVGLDGESLPLDDASADAVLATWTLCSISDPVAAVREVRRVLKPGGRLHFVEHGRAIDAGVRSWQERLNPIQRRLACGCNLTRDIPSLLAAGGMAVDRLSTYFARGEPRPFGATFEGTATTLT